MTVQRHRGARIIDIALQAGVSTATVDRVLNQRPSVSVKTVAKVREAVRWLERSPQRPTVIPTIAKDLTVDVIIAGNAGFSNEALASEIRRTAAGRGVTVRLTQPRRMDPVALARALDRCRRIGSSGVIVQVLEHPTVRTAISQLTTAGIPVVTILTDLPRAENIGYVGLDNRAAGRVAGQLMGRLCRRPGAVAIFWGSHLYLSHEEREMGFRAVMRSEFEEVTLLDAIQVFDDPQKNYEQAADLLSSRSDLIGIYSIGSGNRGIEKAMLESGRTDEVTYVAFNLTPLTRQCLISGVMDAVVHQDMAKVAQTALTAVVDRIAERPVRFDSIPTEIIMRENIPD
ncbi:MAG: LacI family transcriptional regulator [Hyphomicrobiales bacterium]|nr:LacI family transcriptional regulator [Hyphomicrobiales bacterium]